MLLNLISKSIFLINTSMEKEAFRHFEEIRNCSLNIFKATI